MAWFFNRCHELGVLETLRRVYNRIAFRWFSRSLVFLRLDLRSVPDATTPGEMRAVSRADVEKAEEYHDGWFSKEGALRRLQEGHQLFVSCRNEQPVYYQWAELKTAEILWFGLRFLIPDDVVYSTCLFTVPEFRRLGIAYKTGMEFLQYWKGKGVRSVFVVIDPSNTASLRLHHRLGFTEYQTGCYRRWWFLKHYRAEEAGTRKTRSWITIFRPPQALWKAFWAVFLFTVDGRIISTLG